jgi:hypothetical protein
MHAAIVAHAAIVIHAIIVVHVAIVMYVAIVAHDVYTHYGSPLARSTLPCQSIN